MFKKMLQAGQWIGKHWALSLAAFLIVAITATTIVCWNVFGKEQKAMVPIYVTVKGLGEGKDMENRKLMVPEGSAIADIFSLENPEIYEDFGRPLVSNNEFRSFMGVRSTVSKRFYVTINGTYDNILPMAYIWEGAVVVIEYR